jgi:hypothetical protein
VTSFPADFGFTGSTQLSILVTANLASAGRHDTSRDYDAKPTIHIPPNISISVVGVQGFSTWAFRF